MSENNNNNGINWNLYGEGEPDLIGAAVIMVKLGIIDDDDKCGKITFGNNTVSNMPNTVTEDNGTTIIYHKYFELLLSKIKLNERFYASLAYSINQSFVKNYPSEDPDYSQLQSMSSNTQWCIFNGLIMLNGLINTFYNNPDEFTNLDDDKKFADKINKNFLLPDGISWKIDADEYNRVFFDYVKSPIQQLFKEDQMFSIFANLDYGDEKSIDNLKETLNKLNNNNN